MVRRDDRHRPSPVMERFTISLETKLADAFDELMARRGYRNRSEAVRGLLRSGASTPGPRGRRRETMTA
ncbi:ribbon-helix-helix protein, CopG family [Solimonas variicoloris]|uniref:ribbon-helix-helix protein, CopG family n=1 Tax=Solimonas variicoloris TaxID=254408 RepID=UPI000370FF6D|nr:ribbon-helix-helix protein, CopG family [Solimonas variicoloris]